MRRPKFSENSGRIKKMKKKFLIIKIHKIIIKKLKNMKEFKK